ncbi:aminopeptidase C, partial [Cutibacterium granulosum]|uniref:aminopeptidase C n=1 Tax=Cutibacterium granulosum TaxID=33011 RepID=UPI002B234490
MGEDFVLDAAFAAQQAEQFRSDQVGRIVQNAVTTTSVDTVSLDRDVFNGIDPTTSERLDSWSVTNQRHSGRCWEFAGLNVIRAQVMRNLNIENLEFSQNHIAFFDKIEKVNFAFARAVETIDLPDGDEQVRDLLGELSDGGYWPQFVDIVGKYGLVPQWAMPDTESSGNTDRMNRALEKIVRRVVGQIRAARDADDRDTRIAAAREQGLKDAWRVLAIHLGTPPTSFTWQYRDKDKNFHREGTFTPTQFARHIVPGDLDEYVTVQHDPRTENPVGQGYVREHTPYMVGRPGYSYVSAEMDDIKALAIESIC